MRPLAWLTLSAVVLGATAVVAVPVWLIQPFAPQTFDGLAWSHRLKQIAPVLTAVALIASVLLAGSLWRSPARRHRDRRTWRNTARRLALVLLVAGVGCTAWFSRQNHFEWMFRPNPEPAFVTASAVSDVDPGEPIIGVAHADDAIAFPITRVGYHHLVNTTLGGQPIVGTY
jgi:hypothetical protein